MTTQLKPITHENKSIQVDIDRVALELGRGKINEIVLQQQIETLMKENEALKVAAQKGDE